MYIIKDLMKDRKIKIMMKIKFKECVLMRYIWGKNDWCNL